MKALVLAGGRGGAMTPFSASRPKPMMPAGGEYLIDHTLSLLRSAGVNLVNMVVGHKSDVLRAHLSSGGPSGLVIHFVDQGKPAGIGKAVLKAKPLFSPGESFALVYADTLTTSNIFSVALQSFGLYNDPVAAICLTGSSEKYGNVYLGKDMKITKIVEKPKRDAGLGNYVLAGVFVFPYTFFDTLEKSKGDMETALKKTIKENVMRAAIWEDEWLDMAYPWDALTANKMMMDPWKSACVDGSVVLSNTTIKGPVRICGNVAIQAGTVIEGPVYIGPDCFIGNNALIRPYTSIGAGSVIGHGSELKNCVLFPGVTIGGLSFIGDSVVGEGVDIGAGSMTINRTIDHGEIEVKINRNMMKTGLSKLGAFIGDGAVIGASNILAPGVVIESGKKIQHNFSVPSRRRSG